MIEIKVKNYKVDSVDAFSKGLAKAISVDTIGNENIDNHTIELTKVTGANQKEYEVTIAHKDINSKSKNVKLKKGDNLGKRVNIEYLANYVVDEIGVREKLKIKSAEAFFKKLREKGINVEYRTKLNSPALSQIISDIQRLKIGKHPINHRGAGGKEYDNFQPVMSLISFPPVEDNLVSTELSPVKGVNSVLTKIGLSS